MESEAKYKAALKAADKYDDALLKDSITAQLTPLEQPFFVSNLLIQAFDFLLRHRLFFQLHRAIYRTNYHLLYKAGIVQRSIFSLNVI